MQTSIPCICIGLGAGILGGLFGIGGGMIMVPAMMFFFQFSQMTAQGTSLFALLAPVSILAVWRYAQNGHVNFFTGGYIMIGLILGALLGSQLAYTFSPFTMKLLLAGFYFLAAIYVILKP